MSNISGRLELHSKLKAIVPNVYYQKPDGVDIEYPCIIYDRWAGDVKRANNKKYALHDRYILNFFTRREDSIELTMDALFDYCSLDTIHNQKGMYQETYTLYYRK